MAGRSPGLLKSHETDLKLAPMGLRSGVQTLEFVVHLDDAENAVKVSFPDRLFRMENGR
jgi:hypothetical protein